MISRALLVALFLLPTIATAQLRWEEGRHYQLLAHPTTPASRKIEVTEVFSYACIHCYHAKDQMAKLRASLPPDVLMNYVHASFQPQQAWPMFQRAWYTAQALGIAESVNDQMFKAIWETGEMPLLDKTSGAVKNPLPTIEDAARVYAHFSKVKEAAFLKLAKSPKIDAEMKRADSLVQTWQIPGTPTVIVNGRYMIENSALAGWDDLRQLTSFLIGLERQRLKR
jgi:protein dithiol oxidoreductase (disulfide-forming)